MRTRCAVVLGLSALLGAGGAFAQEREKGAERPNPQGPLSFESQDKDGDGKISREEFRGPEQFFDRLDANKDDALTRDELASARREFGRRIAERLKGQDKDGDGKISRDEFQGPELFFDRLDANDDGSLSSDEIERAGAGPGPRGEQARDDERPREGPRARDDERPREGRRAPEGERPREGQRPGGAASEADRGQDPDPFREVDRDGDGKISREEARAAFDRLDADDDGSLTREEIGRAMIRQVVERLREMDRDNDGKISREEFRGPTPFFDRLDADNDGSLTREEVGAAIRRIRDEQGRREGGGDRPAGEGRDREDRPDRPERKGEDRPSRDR